MNIRLIIAIVTSLLDEFAILAIILWGLPRLGIRVPWPWLVVIIALVFVYAVVTFRVGSAALSRKPLAGLTSMVETRGKVVRRLDPEGMVKIMGELWQARAETGTIEIGTEIIVTGQDSLMLTVKPVNKE